MTAIGCRIDYLGGLGHFLFGFGATGKKSRGGGGLVRRGVKFISKYHVCVTPDKMIIKLYNPWQPLADLGGGVLWLLQHPGVGIKEKKKEKKGERKTHSKKLFVSATQKVDESCCINFLSHANAYNFEK